MLWFWDSISRRYQYWVKPLITITSFISYGYVMFLVCTIRRSLYWTFFFSFLKNFILFFNFTILYWFWNISTWICHRYTCAPHPSVSSQCTSPKHPVSCIKPGLATCFIYDIIHVPMPFSQIIPPSPSPTESKRLFYTSVSLLRSHIQGYCYHLLKIYILKNHIYIEKPQSRLTNQLSLNC